MPPISLCVYRYVLDGEYCAHILPQLFTWHDWHAPGTGTTGTLSSPYLQPAGALHAQRLGPECPSLPSALADISPLPSHSSHLCSSLRCARPLLGEVLRVREEMQPALQMRRAARSAHTAACPLSQCRASLRESERHNSNHSGSQNLSAPPAGGSAKCNHRHCKSPFVFCTTVIHRICRIILLPNISIQSTMQSTIKPKYIIDRSRHIRQESIHPPMSLNSIYL